MALLRKETHNWARDKRRGFAPEPATFHMSRTTGPTNHLSIGVGLLALRIVRALGILFCPIFFQTETLDLRSDKGVQFIVVNLYSGSGVYLLKSNGISCLFIACGVPHYAYVHMYLYVYVLCVPHLVQFSHVSLLRVEYHTSKVGALLWRGYH